MKPQGIMLTQLAYGRFETNSGMSFSQMFFKPRSTASSLGLWKIFMYEPCVRSLWPAWGKRWRPLLFIFLFLLLLGKKTKQNKTGTQPKLALSKQSFYKIFIDSWNQTE